MPKRIFALLLSLILALILVSCTPESQTENGLFKIADAKGIPESSEDKDSNVDETEENGNTDNGGTGENIILNVSSKKIHLSDECTYASSMSDANKRIEPKDKLQQYLGSGYLICSNCNKKYSDGN